MAKKKLDKKFYEEELKKLQIELVKLQEWIKYKGLKVVVIFEGRDAAGKGGVIKRITESLNPRYLQSRSSRHPDGTRKNSMVLPALCPPSSGRGRDGAV